MNKETLMQYGDLQKEIPKLKKRIERIEEQSDMIGDVVQNGYKRHAVIYGYDGNKQDKLSFLKTMLDKRRDKLSQIKIDIEVYIDTIEKSDIRQIFEHRYIDNMSWVQIQHAMGYRYEDTARKKHDRFLEKNL